MDQTALLGGKPPYGWFYVRAMPRGLIGLSSLKCTLGHFDTSAPRGREVRLLKSAGTVLNGHIVTVKSGPHPASEWLSHAGVTFVMLLDKTAHLRWTRGCIMDILLLK